MTQGADMDGKRLSDAELVFALRTIGDRPIETAEGICAQAADALERLTTSGGNVEERARELLAVAYSTIHVSDGTKEALIRAGKNPSIPANAAVLAVSQALSQSPPHACCEEMREAAAALVERGTCKNPRCWCAQRIGLANAIRTLPLPPSPVKESRDAALEIPKTVTAYEAVVRLMEREGKPIAAAIWQSNADALKSTPHQGGEGK